MDNDDTTTDLRLDLCIAITVIALIALLVWCAIELAAPFFWMPL